MFKRSKYYILLSCILSFSLCDSYGMDNEEVVKRDYKSLVTISPSNQVKSYEGSNTLSINEILPVESLSLIFSYMNGTEARSNHRVCRQWNDIYKSQQLPSSEDDAIVFINTEIERIFGGGLPIVPKIPITIAMEASWSPMFIMKVDRTKGGWPLVSRCLFLQEPSRAGVNLRNANEENINRLAQLLCEQFWGLVNHFRHIDDDAITSLFKYIWSLQKDINLTYQQAMMNRRYLPFIERHISNITLFKTLDIGNPLRNEAYKTIFAQTIRIPFTYLLSAEELGDALIYASDDVLKEKLKKALVLHGKQIDSFNLSDGCYSLEYIAYQVCQRTGDPSYLDQVAQVFERSQNIEPGSAEYHINWATRAAELLISHYMKTGTKWQIPRICLLLNKSGYKPQALELKLEYIYLTQTSQELVRNQRKIAREFVSLPNFARAEKLLLQSQIDARSFSHMNRLLFRDEVEETNNELIMLYEFAFHHSKDPLEVASYADKAAELLIERAKDTPWRSTFYKDLKAAAYYCLHNEYTEIAARLFEMIYHYDRDFQKLESQGKPKFQLMVVNLQKGGEVLEIPNPVDSSILQAVMSIVRLETRYHIDHNAQNLDEAIMICEEVLNENDKHINTDKYHDIENIVFMLAHLNFLKERYALCVELFKKTKRFAKEQNSSSYHEEEMFSTPAIGG